MTAAWTYPVEFVRVVASLMPRELEAIIARGIEGGLDPAATDEDARIIQ